MKIKLILPLLFLLFITEAKSSDSTHIQFIGINPSFTVEPYYEKGQFDVNVFPFVYQRALGRQIHARVAPIQNLRIGNGKLGGFSHYGMELALPIFFSSKLSPYEAPSGIFIAPLISYTKNVIEFNKSLVFAVEPGYQLKLNQKYTISFGVQFGYTNFIIPNTEDRGTNHFGIKVIFGSWF